MNKCQVLVLWISWLLFKEVCRIGEVSGYLETGKCCLEFYKGFFFFFKVEFVWYTSDEGDNVDSHLIKWMTPSFHDIIGIKEI